MTVRGEKKGCVHHHGEVKALQDTLDGEEPLLVALSAERHWANSIVLSSSSSWWSHTNPAATRYKQIQIQG